MATTDNGLPLSKPIVTKGKTLIAVDAAGNEVSRTGDKNWRNNNPGNLRAFDDKGIEYKFTTSQPGYIGTDPDGFAIFSTQKQGYDAQAKLITGPTYSNLSLQDALKRYDSEEAAQYLKIVQKETGLPANMKIKDMTPAQQDALKFAMTNKAEGNMRSGKIAYTSGTPNTNQLYNNSTAPTGAGNLGAPVPTGLTSSEVARLKGTSLNQAQSEELTNLVGQRTRLEAQLKQAKLLSAGATNAEVMLLENRLKSVNKEIERKTGTFGVVNAEAAKNEAQLQDQNNNVLSGVPWNGTIPKEQARKIYEPLPNKLLQYATYTYGLSLHLLTKDQYNEVIKTEQYTPKNVLVASAGRYNTLGEGNPNSFVRNKFFSRDYYFENLEITTIIGNTEFNRMTNAVDITFTLIEPYGITLLDNLINACRDPEIDSKNYLDMPYLIELDFYANSDTGELLNKIPGLTKRFPVLITKMDIKASARGSEYRIKAQPFNHSAYQVTTVGVPVAITVVAGTVAEFFQSTEATGTPPELENDSRETSKSTLYRLDNKQFANNGQAVDSSTIPTINLSKASLARLRQVSSFGGALNDWYKELKNKNKLDTNDEYFFEFDPEIANSQFSSITNNTTDPKNTRMAGVDNTISIRLASATQQSSKDFDSTLREFQINAGTSIDKVLATVIRYSDYVQKQIILPEDYAKAEDYQAAMEASKQNPLNWFKIVPEIKLGEFDPIKKQWKRFITFHVQKYVVTNVKIELGPQGIALYPSKVYDYIYTGKNDSILDLDIQFNAMYYNSITAFKQKMTVVNNVPQKAEEYGTKNPDSYEGTPQDPNSVMPQVTKPVVLNARNNAAGMELSARDVASGDLEESLLTMSDADMVKVNLTILGDPDFIKQDDVFFKPKHLAEVAGDKPTGTDERLAPNGSLLTDRGDIHALVTIRTPIDIDESTGLMEFDSKFSRSVFSGLYKVVKVVSTFQAGMFKQVLEMVRLVRQTDYEGGKKKEAVERTKDASQPSDALTLNNNNNTQEVAGNNGTPADPNSDPGDAQKSAQDQQATENKTTEGDTPAVTDEQKKLIEKAPDMETKPVNSATQPQAVVPSPNAGKIKGLEQDLGYAEASLDQQQRNLNSAQELIAIAQKNLAYAQSSNNQSEITTWQNSIAERNRSLASVQQQYDAAKAKVDGIRSQIAALQ